MVRVPQKRKPAWRKKESLWLKVKKNGRRKKERESRR